MPNSGIYFLKLKKPAFDLPTGQIIYIGKGNDVEKRSNQELGIIRGAATFFRSIGLLLGKTVIPGSGKNFRFREHREIMEWLVEHVEKSIRICDWRNEERPLIEEYKPPFNYTYNTKHYYPGLLDLRKEARRTSMICRTAIRSDNAKFTLQTGKWYACVLIGDEFEKDKCSYSPVKIYSVEPENNGDRTFLLNFYHANYPEGVREKIYRLRVIERGKTLLIAKSLDHSPLRFILLYDITSEWILRHFRGLDPGLQDMQEWLERNA